MFSKKLSLFSIFLIVLFCGSAYGQIPTRFKSPESSDRLTTYWMFLNGNITKEGITKDLEAMKAAGVNGTLFFSVGYFQPGPVKFMSEQWWDAIAHAMKESDRLKMQFGIYNSDGWSMSGGPWISAEESMKQLVWADTVVQGSKNHKIKLPQPQVNSVYKDVSILAFPAIEDDSPLRIKNILSSDLSSELPGSATESIGRRFLAAENGKVPNVTVDFGREIDIRRIVFDEIKINPFLEASAKLEYSNDGKTFIPVALDFPLNLKSESIVKQLTFTFPKISARYLRLNVNFESSTKKPVPITQSGIDLGKIMFYKSPRMNLWEPKSGNSKRIRHERQETFMTELSVPVDESLPRSYTIDQSRQIDLSKLVDQNGVLNWKAPEGRWIIQRIGFTSTHRKVGPATREGAGFECNKMDAKAVEKHFNAYSAKFIDLSKKLLGRPIDCIQMESWEAGIQNWTDGLELEFQKRNGYSLIPYLPVLAGGFVVDSYDVSDRFLWDFRNTISQLIAENYWGTMYRMAQAKGVKVSGEGSGMQHYLYDPMRYQQYLDIPMGEFWPNEGHVRADIKNSSSVANTYGRNLAGAESFTSGYEDLWSVTPADLKQIGDEAFALGTNHIVLHTYVHQPYDVAPGFTLGKFGNHLQRLNPWYNHAKGWFDYLARCQYMLRQGKSIQDIAYFTGEGVPSYLGLPWEVHPRLPEGFDYDGVNTDIIKQMTVRDGQLYLPSGASYKLLVFQDITRMTPVLVNEIKRLVSAGATIISLKPQHSPSLTGNLSADKEVRQVADEVWGNVDGKTVREHVYGKGRVYAGVDIAEILKRMKIIPDFLYQAENDSTKINYLHRRTADSDIYFLANYDNRAVKVNCIFRVDGRIPELWDADKGLQLSLPYKVLNKNQIEVALDFGQQGSLFIVFKANADKEAQVPRPRKELAQYSLNKAWNVNFQSPTAIFTSSFSNLADWSESNDERIRYFSGTASYSQDFKLKKSGKDKVELDLGEVNNNLVTVKVNGQQVAHLWRAPYRADITQFIKNGKNHLEIAVTNTAVNSLIGDERYPADLVYEKNSNVREFPSWLRNKEDRKSQRQTFVTYRYLTKDSKLDPSGMVGPVMIRISE